MDSLIAVMDIGKTHAKLLLVEERSGEVRWEKQYICRAGTRSDFRELDIARLETWLIENLRAAPERERIRHLFPVAHGAAAIWIDAEGRRLAAPDYEDRVFDLVAADYRKLRDNYTDTYSPFLPVGLNLGRQYYFLQTRHPEIFEQARWALLYPQYWAWRFSGVAASEITSLGCHSDLWRPVESRPAELAMQQGWERLRPPLRRAGEVLGVVTPEIAQETGLDAECLVYCGIHDSNASYLCHLAEEHHSTPSEAPHLSVVSSGTWTVVLTQGEASLRQLREPLDMLANIDAYGHPVATARFMGGREYAEIAGATGREATPTRRWLFEVLLDEAMALPCFSPLGGPYAGHKGFFVHADRIENAAARATLATLYMALMTDLLLDNLGARGAVAVDGPLSLNSMFNEILQTLRQDGAVYASVTPHGAAAAARYLVTGVTPKRAREPAGSLPNAGALEDYRAEWRAQIRLIDVCLARRASR